MGEANVWSYFARLGVEVRMPHDPFFSEGDRLARIQEPVHLTIQDVEEFLHRDFAQFNCQVPGCKESFSQLYESEQHYSAVHRHACSVCRKSLPSNHLLEIHIQETHDSFFAVLSEKKPSYQCFLPTCSSLFWNSGERRDHTITCHNFPPDFRYDQQHSYTHNRRHKNQRKKSTDTAANQENGDNSAANSENVTANSENIAAKIAANSENCGRQKTSSSNNNRRQRRLAAAAAVAAAAAASMESLDQAEKEEEEQGMEEDDPSVGGCADPVVAGGVATAIPVCRPSSLPMAGGHRGEPEGRLSYYDSHTARNGHIHSQAVVSNGAGMEVDPTVGTDQVDCRVGVPRGVEVDRGAAGGHGVVLRRESGPKRPVSLARMGDRHSVHLVESPTSPPPLPPPSLLSHGASSPDVSAGGAGFPSPGIGSVSRLSRPPSLRQGIGCSSLGNSPAGKTAGDSPSKLRSRIPIRSSSCRVPKTLSFGAGVARGFHRPKSKQQHWYQSSQSVNTSTDIETTDLSQLKDALTSA